MCKADLGKVVIYLKQHKGEPKLLSQWYSEINDTLTRGRRLTPRELAFAFRVIKKKELMNVSRESCFYCFL